MGSETAIPADSLAGGLQERRLEMMLISRLPGVDVSQPDKNVSSVACSGQPT
jgi:hypothetical protein